MEFEELISKMDRIDKALNRTTTTCPHLFDKGRPRPPPPIPEKFDVNKTVEEMKAERQAWISHFRNDPSDQELTPETVENKFRYIWYKGHNTIADIQQLVSFLEFANNNPVLLMQLRVCIVHSLLHLYPPCLLAYMPVNLWYACANYTASILNNLQQYPYILLDMRGDPPYGVGSSFQERKKKQGYIRIWGRLVDFIVWLHCHLYRGLSFNNDKNEEFNDWLPAELMLFSLAQTVQSYLEWRGHFKDASKVALTQVELVYYQPGQYYTSLLAPLVALIYEHGGKKTNSRALLCEIYHQAIMDHFSMATDLLVDIPSRPWFQGIEYYTFIPFNRAIAQVALCAFRLGFIEQAHILLSKLFATPKLVDELLGQGFRPCTFLKTTPQEEELMRKRQLPRHMRISLELLAAVYVICVLLVDLKSPRNGDDPMGVMIRTVHQVSESGASTELLERFSHRIFVATAFLMKGDFQNSFNIIRFLDIWSLLGNPIYVFELLKTKMKEVAVSMYFLSNKSRPLDQLTIMFDLSEAQMLNIVTESSSHHEFKWSETLSILAEGNKKAMSFTV